MTQDVTMLVIMCFVYTMWIVAGIYDAPDHEDSDE